MQNDTNVYLLKLSSAKSLTADRLEETKKETRQFLVFISIITTSFQVSFQLKN